MVGLSFAKWLASVVVKGEGQQCAAGAGQGEMADEIESV